MRRAAGALLAVVLLTACGGPDEGGAVATPASASPADGCPQRWGGSDDEPWVPAPPTTETPGRLVPDADPVEATVCRYDGSGALEGDVVLQDGLDRIRTDLLVPARVEGAALPCVPTGGEAVPHLLRLRYADGDLWLAAVQRQDACTTSGNGVFVSSAFLGDALERSYRSGGWVPPDLDPCAPTALGRAGQERSLLPPGWTSLVVCGDGRPRELAVDRAQQVGALLAQLEARPAQRSCDGTPAVVLRLAAVYAHGPPVGLSWRPGCTPSVGNGSLSAATTPAQTELLDLLVG
jgi:hypothetical protein